MTMTADEYINSVLDVMPRAMPRRTHIAAELRGHIAERVQSGQPLEAVLRGLGDPAALAASFLAAVPLVPAPLWRRGVAKLIDLGLGGARRAHRRRRAPLTPGRALSVRRRSLPCSAASCCSVCTR